MAETNILYDFAVFTLKHSQNPLFLLAEAVTISENDDDSSVYTTSTICDGDSTISFLSSSPTTNPFNHNRLNYNEIPFGKGSNEMVSKFYDQRNDGRQEFFKDRSLNFKSIKSIKSRHLSNYLINHENDNKKFKTLSNLKKVKDSQHIISNHVIGSNYKIPPKKKKPTSKKPIPKKRTDDDNTTLLKKSQHEKEKSSKSTVQTQPYYVTRSNRISKPSSKLAGGRWGGI